jgi:DNA-binding transcriptional LysR family regulator
LLPLAVEFLAAYREISLRLMLTDRVVNPTEENIDTAIRVGVLPDSSMIAARVGSIRSLTSCFGTQTLGPLHG